MPDKEKHPHLTKVDYVLKKKGQIEQLSPNLLSLILNVFNTLVS